MAHIHKTENAHEARTPIRPYFTRDEHRKIQIASTLSNTSLHGFVHDAAVRVAQEINDRSGLRVPGHDTNAPKDK